MITLEEAFLVMELQADLVRWLPNCRDLINEWRYEISIGKTPGYNCTLSARAMLGRLRRMHDFRLANPIVFDNVITTLGMSHSPLLTKVFAFRDAMRIFRDAPKTNNTETSAAIDVLDNSLPVLSERYLNSPLPSDW